MWDDIIDPFPICNGYTVEVLEWINNFMLYFLTDVITYSFRIKPNSCYQNGPCRLVCKGLDVLWHKATMI